MGMDPSPRRNVTFDAPESLTRERFTELWAALNLAENMDEVMFNALRDEFQTYLTLHHHPKPTLRQSKYFLKAIHEAKIP